MKRPYGVCPFIGRDELFLFLYFDCYYYYFICFIFWLVEDSYKGINLFIILEDLNILNFLLVSSLAKVKFVFHFFQFGLPFPFYFIFFCVCGKVYIFQISEETLQLNDKLDIIHGEGIRIFLVLFLRKLSIVVCGQNYRKSTFGKSDTSALFWTYINIF